MAEMIADFVMEAEVTQKIGAEPHERSDERTGYRNGHRERHWDTRLGTLSLTVPKLREGASGRSVRLIPRLKRRWISSRRSPSTLKLVLVLVGRFVNMVDHDVIYWTLLLFQLQAELFLKGCKDGGTGIAAGCAAVKR